jgi:hypothetical protein
MPTPTTPTTTDAQVDILREGMRSIREAVERLDDVLAEPENAELEFTGESERD